MTRDFVGEALHGGQRLAAEGVFAVEIVLDDPGVGRPRHVEHGEPLLERHGDAERMLAGGGEVDEARRGMAYLRHLPAVAVDRQRPQPGAGAEEGAARAEISRLLHPHGVAFVEQQAGEEIERRLAAGGDDDLLRRAADPPHGGEEAGDDVAQFGMAGDVVVAEEILAAEAGAPRQRAGSRS